MSIARFRHVAIPQLMVGNRMSSVRRRLCWVLVDSECQYPLGGRSVEIIVDAVGDCLGEAVLEGGVS
jgi:hypothetical protein